VQSGGERPSIEPKAPEKIAFTSNFAPKSIVIDTDGRKLYYILSSTEAYRYPISVGREGFSWTGTEVISRKQEWPDWYPPKEMIARDPKLPDKMTGGLHNPLGVLALYLGNTLYRIHGTNDASSIGHAVSSGCFRMRNEHILHLATIAPIGTPVIVVKSLRTLPAPPVAQNLPIRTPPAPPCIEVPAEPQVVREYSGWRHHYGEDEDEKHAERYENPRERYGHKGTGYETSRERDEHKGTDYEDHRETDESEVTDERPSVGSKVSLHTF
jgi:hypothetical protein